MLFRSAGDSLRPGVLPEDFIEALHQDLQSAARRVVFYSPTLDMTRLSGIEGALEAAGSGRLRVHVVTRPLAERRKSEVDAYEKMHRRIASWGGRVIPWMRLAEKLVVIDDRILWFGAVDPLGHADAAEKGDFQGTMVRAVGRPLVDFVRRHLRVDALLEAWNAGGHPPCPVCGREVVAAAGKHWPFYWRCMEAQCYSRTIDAPPPAPMGEEALRCARCGGDVAFGAWGGTPCWRCKANRKHRQPVTRAHLTAPETAQRIPPGDLARLRKAFGIGAPSS